MPPMSSTMPSHAQAEPLAEQEPAADGRPEDAETGPTWRRPPRDPCRARRATGRQKASPTMPSEANPMNLRRNPCDLASSRLATISSSAATITANNESEKNELMTPAPRLGGTLGGPAFGCAVMDQQRPAENRQQCEEALHIHGLTEQEHAHEGDHRKPEAFPERIGDADGEPGRGEGKAVVRKPDQREHGHEPPRWGPSSQPSCWDIFITEVPPTSNTMAQNKKKPMLHMRYRRHRKLRRLEAHTRKQSAATPG